MFNNPDYPTMDTNFNAFTYNAPAPGSEMYYYNGFNGYNNAPMDSRRNMNGFAPNPFSNFGQVSSVPLQNNSIPENMVQPFSSYPPSTPMALNQGLNPGCMDPNSRRNVVGTNPWANQQPQQPQANPFQNTMMSGFMQTPNPFDCSGMNYNMYSDPNIAALFNPVSIPQFDKKNSWDNYYTQPRPIDMPNINWNNNNYMGMPSQQYAFPVQNNVFANTTTENWNDIANNNWKQQIL